MGSGTVGVQAFLPPTRDSSLSPLVVFRSGLGPIKLVDRVSRETWRNVTIHGPTLLGTPHATDTRVSSREKDEARGRSASGKKSKT